MYNDEKFKVMKILTRIFILKIYDLGNRRFNVIDISVLVIEKLTDRPVCVNVYSLPFLRKDKKSLT